MNTGTIAEAYYALRKRLRAEGIGEPDQNAHRLFTGITGLDRLERLQRSEEAMRQEWLAALDAGATRLIAGEPVHRILGYRPFFGRDIQFDEHCLEPRPETELLVERVLNDWSTDGDAQDGNLPWVRFVDLGTGSGAIAVSLLAERAHFSAVATDISEGALSMVAQNADRFGVTERLQTRHGSWFEALDQGDVGAFDFLVSNPPYIRAKEYGSLAPNVSEHDPRAALVGGADGLACYRAILADGQRWLKPGGILYLETGHSQHDAIQAIGEEFGWGSVSTHLDLAGLQRIVVLRSQF